METAPHLPCGRLHGKDGHRSQSSPCVREVRLTLSNSEAHSVARPSPLEEQRRSLSVVVPVLNEERGLEPLIARLRPVLDGLDLDWEVIFVDDGSTDGTLAKLRSLHSRDSRFKAVSLSRNFGKEVAMAAGLSYVTGDGAVLMDADLQHPPELIRDFVAHWRSGFEIVYGQRRDRDADAFLHRLAARAFYAAFHKLSGTELPAGAGDFRLLGLSEPAQLAGRDPYALYDRLCAETGVRHDPCVIDVFIAAVRYMEGGPKRPWWAFTAERKRELVKRASKGG